MRPRITENKKTICEETWVHLSYYSSFPAQYQFFLLLTNPLTFLGTHSTCLSWWWALPSSLAPIELGIWPRSGQTYNALVKVIGSAPGTWSKHSQSEFSLRSYFLFSFCQCYGRRDYSGGRIWFWIMNFHHTHDTERVYLREMEPLHHLNPLS